MTPGAPFTPAAGMEHEVSDWILNNIEVKIRESHDNVKLIHQIGVVIGTSVSVALMTVGSVLNHIILIMQALLVLSIFMKYITWKIV